MQTLFLNRASRKPSPIRNRSLFLLWTGELISNSGSALSTLAGSILIYQQTGSAFMVSMLLVASALPSLLIGLLAGVIVDRFDRKRIMIVSDLLRAAFSFSIPLLISHNHLFLYGAVLFSSSVGQFFSPALESILPEIASAEELRTVNSWMAISGFGATTIGFAVCGIIASHFPIEWAFYADALSFLISATCIWRISILPLRVEGRMNLFTAMSNLKDGGRYLIRNSALHALFLITLPVLLAFGLWNALLLPFTLHILHATTFEYGVQEGLTCIGFLLGSLLVMRMGNRIKEGKWLVLSFFGMGIFGLIYAFSTNVPLSIGLVMLTGFLNAPYSIARRLIIQRNTHRAVRGRVNSAFFMARDVVYLVGMASAGLADVLGLQVLIIMSAFLLIVAGSAALFILHLVHSSQANDQISLTSANS